MPSAAILAGGRARRFGGRDKCGLVIGGRSILERQLAALRPLTHDILIVGRPSPPQSGAAISDAIRTVPDQRVDRGPLGGLSTALAEAREAPLILVACDMPFVTTDLFAHLVALASGVDAAVPRTARGVHPLCAAYAPGCRDIVEQQIAGGRLAMHDLLARLRVRTLDEGDLRRYGDPHHLLANVNTPEEYASLAALPGNHNK